MNEEEQKKRNEENAAKIRKILEQEYSDVVEDEWTAVGDLLADIMHFCNKKHIVFSECLDQADKHFKEETDFPEDTDKTEISPCETDCVSCNCEKAVNDGI